MIDDRLVVNHQSLIIGYFAIRPHLSTHHVPPPRDRPASPGHEL
jgi:hypothetical protein